MKTNYKIFNKKIIYNGFFKLYELSFSHLKYNGDWTPKLKREIFSGSQVASVIPYDPINNKLILLKQMRAGVLKQQKDPLMIEIVAGLIDKGETPEKAAKRECYEETGCKIKKIINIHSYFPAPGSSESFYHLFLGEINSFKGERILGSQEENEDILAKCYDVDEVRKLLKQKKILNGLTLLALQWFFLEYYKN